MTLADWIVLALALVLVFDSGPSRRGGTNRNERPDYPRPPAPPAPPPKARP